MDGQAERESIVEGQFRGIDGRFASDASLWLPNLEVESAWREHAPFAFWLTEAHRPDVFAELGVHNGYSYAAFCQAVDRIGLDTRCFGVDTFAGDEHAGFYGPEVLGELQSYHDVRYGSFSRLIPATFSDAAQQFDDGTIDLLHIDGRHFYDDVREDYSIWLPKLSRRGVVLFHDTNVRERGFGVWRFWEELRDRHPSFEFFHGYGLGVLAVGPDVGGAVAELCRLDRASSEAGSVRALYERLGSTLSAKAAERGMRTDWKALSASSEARIGQLAAEHAVVQRAAEQSAADLRSFLEREQADAAALQGRIEALALDLERSKFEGQALAIARDEVVAERDEVVAERDEVVAERDEVVAERDEVVAERDEVVAERQRLVEDVARGNASATVAAQSQEKLKNRAEKAERKYARLSNRRVVRLALKFAEAFRPVFRTIRGQGRRQRPVPSAPSVVLPEVKPNRRKIVKRILELRPEGGPTSGPHVSIVMLTRNGRDHLERVLTGLRDTTLYRSFDLVVIDNASSDNSSELLALDWGYPIRVLRNEANESFSAGCNQGIAASEGEYVLLLNNDVEPINAGWLGALVDQMEGDRSLDATGALLVYPEAPDGADSSDRRNQLTIQHRGIAFRWRYGIPLGYNLGSGEDPTEPGLVATAEVPGVTAACMLVRRSVLDTIGELDDRFVYGFEDVDLNLRIRELGGRIALVGGAVLFHHEFGTQSAQGRHRQRAYRSANLHHFAEKWAPRLGRTLHLSTVSTGGIAWSGTDGRKVAITLTKDDPDGAWGDWYTAHELGDAFAAVGWEVVYAEAYEERWRDIPEDTDLVVSLLDRYDVGFAPEGAITVAWIRNWVDRWIERPWAAEFDALVPSSQTSAELLEAAGLHVAGILPLATNPDRFCTMESDSVYECDYTFTGNHWGVDRALLHNLEVAPGERFSIFGNGWDAVGRAARYWRGAVPYDDLPLVYNAAKIVLDDTAGPTLPYGAVNSRVFDALACGTLVLTNNGLGSDESFGGLLPAYSSREELRALLDTYLGDPELRASTAAELQRMVLEHHTYAARANQFIGLVRDRLAAPRVALKIGPPNHDEAEMWGDTHFARALARSLERQGCATSVDILPEWDLLSSQPADIVVHLRGLVPYVPKPGQVNVLWIISHPEDVSDDECERYDLVLVASDAHAATLGQRLSVPVVSLLQASAFDAAGFAEIDSEAFPAPSDVLFVGNSRGVMRHGVEWSIERGIPIDVYGSGWNGLIDASHVVAEHLPNEQLAAVYRSAGVVLNDHWPGMRDYGFISNRVFDVLASGGFVISDSVAGIDGVFGEVVPTYDSAEDLERLVRYYQEHPDERADLVGRGQELVASEHTFDRRAEQFLSMVLPLWKSRPHTVEGSG